MNNKNTQPDEKTVVSDLEVADPIANLLLNPVEDEFNKKDYPNSILQNFIATMGGLMILIVIVSMMFPGYVTGFPELKIQYSYGLFLGILPINLVNKIILLIMGFSGISSSRYQSCSLVWSAITFFVAALFSILGTSPHFSTFFGYMPLFGGQIIFNSFICLSIIFAVFIRKV